MKEKEYKIVSYNSLIELCKVNDIDKSIILGDVNGENNKFEVIMLADNSFVCAIVYYDYGIKPRILAQEDKSIWFIGFSKMLICFDYDIKKIFVQKELPSLFYEFIKVDSQNVVIAICELDVFVFKNDGEIIWNIGFRDIIIDFYIRDNKLFIKCNDEDETIFLIIDGTIV